MPLPWLQIVQLVPSILEVSRELMKRTRKMPAGGADDSDAPPTPDALAGRVASLEENERRQAELVAQIAEQLAGVARAVTDLHRRIVWLTAIAGSALVAAVVALALTLSN